MAASRRLDTPSPTVTFSFDTDSSSGWTTGDGGTYPMTRGSGSTPSSSTGPSAGVWGSGYYYYAEVSSPRAEGDIFTLSYDGTVCIASGLVVAFHYHMYGNEMGMLSVVNGLDATVWSQSGNQGNAWAAASADVYTDLFRFEYVRGKEPSSITIPAHPTFCFALPARPSARRVL